MTILAGNATTADDSFALFDAAETRVVIDFILVCRHMSPDADVKASHAGFAASGYPDTPK
jgi:hypothetical protein